MSVVFFSVHNTPKWPLAHVQQYPGKDLIVPVPVLEAGTRLEEVRETPQKYFHESTFDAHYDARFGVKGVSQEQRRFHLRALIQAYLSAMNNIGIETWLMHGSLLGWHWNRKVLPWDHDLDVQVSLQGMRHLVDYHNTTFPAVEPFVARDRHRYLLDINPNWVNTDTADGGNKIDARFVDTTIGLYVDITVLHRDNRAAAQSNKRVMMCKDGHRYNYEDIFPLQTTEFEGIAAKVPSSSASVLTKEYGVGSLNNTVYGDHRFDADLGEWVHKST
ncbi:hypothetical protein MBLNU13_g09045t1 [Cladosporium sp. NU13]